MVVIHISDDNHWEGADEENILLTHTFEHLKSSLWFLSLSLTLLNCTPEQEIISIPSVQQQHIHHRTPTSPEMWGCSTLIARGELRRKGRVFRSHGYPQARKAWRRLLIFLHFICQSRLFGREGQAWWLVKTKSPSLRNRCYKPRYARLFLWPKQ